MLFVSHKAPSRGFKRKLRMDMDQHGWTGMFLIHETHKRHEIKMYFREGEVAPEPQTRGLRFGRSRVCQKRRAVWREPTETKTLT